MGNVAALLKIKVLYWNLWLNEEPLTSMQARFQIQITEGAS